MRGNKTTQGAMFSYVSLGSRMPRDYSLCAIRPDARRRGRWRQIGMLGFVLLLLSAVPATAAGGAEPREAHAAGFRYLVFETAGAKSEAALPMIVGLHYSSAKPETMLEYFDGIDFPARIVLPQGAHPRRDGYSWFPTGYAQLGQAERDAAVFDAEKRLASFVGAVPAEYPTRGKPMVMGISYGGDLSFLLAVRHPELLSAAFPVAARFLLAWMPRTNTCKPACPPILAMHGDADRTVPMAPTQEAIERLRKMRFDIELKPYPGVGHDFDARMERDFAELVRATITGDR